AAVVQAGEVLGLEGPDGTDALIDGAAPRQAGGGGAILVKARKPQQQMRADPPVIGAATIRHAAMARFRGVAIEAGGVLVIDAPSVAAVADAAGMFVIGIEGP
ncbi:MAG TPA: UDP-2,3-diacylglucosamine diphosphatase LpxI, partial [Dongiaceae bacterium]|nr:UDP-2,3-diacylglucosamine diphosphatase LpxI [Dongiaceae bacterium]